MTRKIATAIVPAIIFISCAGPEKKESKPIGIIPVSGTAVPLDEFNTIRHEEDYTVYEFGRMEAPGDPDTMLEESKAYRREKETSWNLNPQDQMAPTGVATTQLPTASNKALIADYEMRVTAMRDEFRERERIIIEQNQALIEQSKNYQKETENFKQISTQLLENQQQVLELKQQLQGIKEAEEARILQEKQKPKKIMGILPKFWAKNQ